MYRDFVGSKYEVAHCAPHRTVLCNFAILVFCVALAHALFVLWIGINKPILDLYYFRQTQTALSAYWLWRGGPWLAYETPVLGFPWSIPFEFPLYQGLVALLRAIGIPIEIGGRLVSFSFYLASLWPLWLLFRSLSFGNLTILATSIVFLSSPIYLYWSRTLMIESCALFFSLLWLALLASLLTRPRVTILICTIAAGIAATLVKSTTFPAFGLLGGLLTFNQFLRNKSSASSNPTLLSAVAAGIVPVLVGVLWILYSNRVRAQNPFDTMMTPTSLTSWVFGTWAQRASSDFWRDVVLIRLMPDIFGFGPFVAVLTMSALASRDWRGVLVSAIIAFLTPFAIFTNLYLIHDYYPYANAIFILGAVGLGIGRVADAGYRWLAAVILVALPALQITFFWSDYARFLTGDSGDIGQVRNISSLIKQNTPIDGGLIIIGFDSNPAIPYYSERKSLAIPGWAPNDLMQRVFEHPQAFLGDNQFAGIVFCPAEWERRWLAWHSNDPRSSHSTSYLDKLSIIRDFIASRRVLAEADGCQFIAAYR